MQEVRNTTKLFIGSASVIMLILYLWKILHVSNCLNLIFIVFILLTISWSYIELKIQERICFRDCYFNADSLIAKLLSSRMLIIVFYILLSIMMSITLVYSVMDFTKEFWMYLLVHILIVTFLYKKLLKLFDGTINKRYTALFAREWTIRLSTILLLGVYVYMMLNGYEPLYLRESLHETIRTASSSIHSQCSYIDTILRLKVELDSTFWWITSNASALMKSEALKTLIWVSFISINSIALLGLNRFIVQIVYGVDKIFNSKRMSHEK